MIEFLVDLDVWEIVGLIGAFLYCASYFLVALDYITSCGRMYYVMNLVAAALVAVSLYEHFNVASLVIQCFFMTVSALGFVRHIENRSKQATNFKHSGQSRPYGSISTE